MGDFQVAGHPQPGLGAGVFGPGDGEGTGKGFAEKVAEKSAQVEGLTVALATAEAESNVQQNNQDLKDKVDDLKEELAQAQAELTALQEEMAGVPVTSDAKVGTHHASSIHRDSGVGKSGGTDPTNSNDPTLPPGDQHAEIQSEDTNLFLATSLMAILFKVEAELIHQHIENKDAERVCKQYGFEEIRQWGKVEAQAAYNSDMDAANQLMAQAAAQFMSAGLTVASFAYSTRLTGKMQDEANLARDNPEYTAAANNPKYQAQRNADPTNPLPTYNKLSKDGVNLERDQNGKPIEIKPGKKQIEDAMNKSEKEINDEIIKNQGTALTTTGFAARKATLQNKLDDAKQEVQVADQKMQQDPKLIFWRNTMPQMLGQTAQAAGSVAQSYWMMKKADQDYIKTLAQIARDVSGKYLQSAMDAFSQENQSIQSLIDFLMQAAQKNTQWASVRA